MSTQRYQMDDGVNEIHVVISRRRDGITLIHAPETFREKVCTFFGYVLSGLREVVKILKVLTELNEVVKLVMKYTVNT